MIHVSDMPEEYGEREHISVKFFVAGVLLGLVLSGVMVWVALTHGTYRVVSAVPQREYVVHLSTYGSSESYVAGMRNGSVIAGLGSNVVSIKFSRDGKYLLIQGPPPSKTPPVKGVLKVIIKHGNQVLAIGTARIAPSPTGLLKIPLTWRSGKPELSKVTDVFIEAVTT